MLKNCCGRSSYGKCRTILGFIFSAGLGVLLGILFAPKTGKETRRQIMNKAENMRDDISYRSYELKEKVLVKTEKAHEDFNDMTEDLKEKILEKAERVQDEIITKTGELKEKVKDKVHVIKTHLEDSFDAELPEWDSETEEIDPIVEEAKDSTDEQAVASEAFDKILNADQEQAPAEQAPEKETLAEEPVTIEKSKRTRKKAKVVEEEQIKLEENE